MSITDNTAGDVAFNPKDSDFLQRFSIATIDVNNPEIGKISERMEEPSASVSFRTILIFWITFFTAIKRAVFGKLVKTNSLFFDGISPICREVKENAYSWRALEIIYNLPEFSKKGRILDKVALYWNGLENAKAVRNRFRLTKKILKEEILKRKDKEIKLLSIASGSARAVLEALAEAHRDYGVTFKFRLIDLDPSASEYAGKLAKKLGIQNMCEMITDSTTNMEKVLVGYEPDIIEMVGFLEYRKKQKAVSLLSRLKEIVNSEGTIVVSQVVPNKEMFFLRYVMNWPMVYRTKKEFSNVLEESGYTNRDLIKDPTGIHMVCKYVKK